MRDSLLIYTAYADKFQKLTDEQFGKLIRLMLHYQQAGNVPEIEDGAVALAFDVVKYDIDKNAEKYDRIVERNRENGKKGGRPKNPVGFLGTQKNPEEPKKADNDNDNVNDNENKKESVKKKAPRFLPPTVEEVREYCNERKNNVDAVRFVDFYASKGWMIGSNKMKDWKAAVRTWEKREAQRGASVQHQAEPETDERAKKRHDKYEELTRFYLGEE